MYLSSTASAKQVREAEKARANRQEIIRCLSSGEVTRRDLIRWGLFGAGGMLAWTHGLNPFVGRAYASIPVSRERTFEWGRGASQPTNNPVSSANGPWGVKFNGGAMLAADFGRVSAAPRFNTREIWTLKNGGGGWDHPIHIHFEEGQILARDGKASNVPPWERGRKDVYRLRPGGSITITMQFRDWGGMFMEHCHNTVHEDNAMLLRWEIDASGSAVLKPLPTPIPTPQGVMFQAPTQVLPKA